MSLYEVVIIVKPDASASHIEMLTQSLVSCITDHSGEVTKTEFCGLRHLAYPIKNNRKGHYVLLNVSIPGDGIKEIERFVGLNEDILRFLIVNVETLDNNPSALMKRVTKEVSQDARRY
ncbi:MAG: 30S ribosomal protein S6 [Holosporales bacterium]|jgi:small subunit ribosomal protein S6|nr:30S ribosomal protein S6 [Holosporales bacterium]